MFHSLPPQTSDPERPPNELVAAVVVNAGAGAGARGLLGGAERLKTELEEAARVGLLGGGEVVDTGVERSKRSPMAEEDD